MNYGYMISLFLIIIISFILYIIPQISHYMNNISKIVTNYVFFCYLIPIFSFTISVLIKYPDLAQNIILIYPYFMSISTTILNYYNHNTLYILNKYYHEII